MLKHLLSSSPPECTHRTKKLFRNWNEIELFPCLPCISDKITTTTKSKKKYYDGIHKKSIILIMCIIIHAEVPLTHFKVFCDLHLSIQPFPLSVCVEHLSACVNFRNWKPGAQRKHSVLQIPSVPYPFAAHTPQLIASHFVDRFDVMQRIFSCVYRLSKKMVLYQEVKAKCLIFSLIFCLLFVFYVNEPIPRFLLL